MRISVVLENLYICVRVQPTDIGHTKTNILRSEMRNVDDFRSLNIVYENYQKPRDVYKKVMLEPRAISACSLQDFG